MAIGTVGLLWMVLVAAPPWFVEDRSLEGLKAQNEVRTTLLQGLGGVVLLAGAYVTYQQLTNSREQLREQMTHNREQLQIAQQGQITERFTRAIDQLGHAQLDVRLGGIYALERIARDSPTDRATIGEVLTAFVRSHAPWPPRLSGQYVTSAPIDEVPDLHVRAADVQACLTVLGRGGFAPVGNAKRLDLHAVDLRQATLVGAQLEYATLVGAHLEGADVSDAHLKQADLSDAHLKQAWLSKSNLEGAILRGAHLEGATLIHTNLEGAYLVGANLEGATLYGAHLGAAYLEAANLGGAHLEGASLAGAHLGGARADDNTAWPAGFFWRAAGVIVVGEDTAASGS
jgi:hypothetical protein